MQPHPPLEQQPHVVAVGAAVHLELAQVAGVRLVPLAKPNARQDGWLGEPQRQVLWEG